MAQANEQQDPGDWWSQNAPPAASGFTVDPGHGTAGNPGGAWTPANPAGPGTPIVIPPGGSPSGIAQAPGYDSFTSHWDPVLGQYVPNTAPSTGSGTGTGGGGGGVAPITTQPIGLPTSGYGSAPAPYASNPNAPTYTPLPTYVPPAWQGGDFVNPTEADLHAMPGYQTQLDAGLQARQRSAAAQGTVLNGGTLKALDRYGQDYANTSYQTLRNNALDAYKQKYSQFTDAAGMDLNARTINANQNQNTFANNMQSYTTGNARTLSDYLTNVTTNRNAELDYWQRLQDVNNTGANLAGGSR